MAAGMAAVSIAGAAATVAPPTEPKPVIRTQADLPQPRFPADSALGLLKLDDGAFNAWAKSVGMTAQDTLARYQIDDPATRRLLLGRLKWAQMLNGENEAALETIAAIRAAEEKTDAKLVSGILDEAILRAMIETGARSGPAFEAAFAKRVRNAVAAPSFEVAGTRLKEMKSRQELNSPNLFRGVIANDFEPSVVKAKALDGDTADFVMRAKIAERLYWPLRPVTVAALREVIRAHTEVKPDIWPARDIALSPSDKLTPVIVAIWDTGIDADLFKGRMHPTTKGLAGAPGNGFGPSFNIISEPTDGILRPLSPTERAAYADMVASLQGFQDNEASLDTAEVEAFRSKIASMTPEQSSAFIKQIGQAADYVHGTHVAGIAAAGNPAIRLANIRHTTWTADDIPVTEGEVDNIVAKMKAVSTFIRANRVRVVNMSWLSSPNGFASGLAKDRPDLDEAARKALGRAWFTRVRDAFRAVIDDNPDTLFVGAAGNSNSDTGFDQTFPSSLAAPNLIVVGGVDQAGDQMSMSSTGSNVAVSANGYHVVSVVPGGTQIAGTGTSDAAPQVTNLAAKLLAIRPSLTPAQLVALIKSGSTPSADGRTQIIHPKATVALLKSGKL